jgi:hypothetical protein
VLVSRARFVRLFGLSGLILYCALLLVSSLPVVLGPLRPLRPLESAAELLLHFVGVTPGLEVFPGRSKARAIPHMACFRIMGEGDTNVVLFDDLERCRRRRIVPVRDPFQVFQVKSLLGPLVDLNLGYRRSLVLEPMQPLFLFSDYYCHVPVAERAHVRTVNIDALYVGLNLDDGSTGVVTMGGRRDCQHPSWEIRQP